MKSPLREPFETSSDGITLRGELFLPDSATEVTAVPLCHGIPREGPRRGDPGYLPLAERLANSGYAALIFNFRGCGISDGDFDMAGWGRDAVAVVKSLSGVPRVKRVVVWGFSGGAAAAAWAAAQYEAIAAVALFACPADFASLSALPVASGIAEYFRRVGIIRDPSFPQDIEAWLKGFELINPEKHIAMISPRPALIVHGAADETIPVEHARRLERAAGKNKSLRIIDGAQHRLRESTDAIDAAFAWLKNIKD